MKNKKVGVNEMKIRWYIILELNMFLFPLNILTFIFSGTQFRKEN